MMLSSRLNTIAQWVPEQSRLLDIGTDHALLPIHLLTIGRIPYCVAVDKSVEPMALVLLYVFFLGFLKFP